MLGGERTMSNTRRRSRRGRMKVGEAPVLSALVSARTPGSCSEKSWQHCKSSRNAGQPGTTTLCCSITTRAIDDTIDCFITTVPSPATVIAAITSVDTASSRHHYNPCKSVQDPFSWLSVSVSGRYHSTRTVFCLAIHHSTSIPF